MKKRIIVTYEVDVVCDNEDGLAAVVENLKSNPIGDCGGAGGNYLNAKEKHVGYYTYNYKGVGNGRVSLKV